MLEILKMFFVWVYFDVGVVDWVIKLKIDLCFLFKSEIET